MGKQTLKMLRENSESFGKHLSPPEKPSYNAVAGRVELITEL